MTEYAPIAYFAYNRPWSMLQSLYTLTRCPEAKSSELTIFCDAAKKPEHVANCALVREIAKSTQWCGKVSVVERDSNWGLARSIISGVRDFCDAHGRVIVLEDDLLVSVGFLKYMNSALTRYVNDARILQVSGHQFPLGLPFGSVSFLPIATSWSWATWKRAWDNFEERPDILAILDSKVRNEFDQKGSYPYSAMLVDEYEGRNSSWAIRWNWIVHKNSSLAVYPSQTLVRNIGFGVSSTHTRSTYHFATSPDWDINGESPIMTPIDEQPNTNTEWLRLWRKTVAGNFQTRFQHHIQSLAPHIRRLLGRGFRGIK